MEENSLSSKQNKFHALALLEVGLLEVGFVSIVLLLFFGTLNYFNILPVSETFPSQFGWLPRRNVPNDGSRTNSLQGEILRNNTSPSPANLTPAVFTYDVEKAKTLLTNYIKKSIKQDILPSAIDVRQGLMYGEQITGVEYQFGSNFTVGNATISANFHFKENSSGENDYNIFVKLKLPTGSAATASLANSMLASYFADPFPAANCQTKGAKSYCENFQNMNDGNRGYGILLNYDQANPGQSIAFTCFIPKESAYYNTLTSCISP